MNLLRTLAACTPIALTTCGQVEPIDKANVEQVIKVMPTVLVSDELERIQLLCDLAQAAKPLKQEVQHPLGDGNNDLRSVFSSVDGEPCKLTETPFGEWLVSAIADDEKNGVVCSISTEQLLCRDVSSQDPTLLFSANEWLEQRITESEKAE